METPQSVGGTQNSREKKPSKKTWKIIGAAILLLLLIIFKMVNLALVLLLVSFVGFLIALLYPKADEIFKSKSRSSARWTLGLMTLAFFIAFGMATDRNEKDTKPQQAETQPQVQETAKVENQTPTPPPVSQFVFDVPSLIGKNIDDVKKVLGEPTEFLQPTKQQLALTSIWDMSYTKDDVNLLVTYNPQNKVVSDFFIDGEDKAKLLALGNLQEKSDAYITEFVKAVTDPNKITGVKVSKRLPAELDGSVAYNAVAFQISNNEDYGWTNCRFEINGGIISSGYEYKTSSGIKAKDKLVVPFSEFTKDGDRFNFLAQKPEKLFIACDTNGQHRTNYFSIK